MPLSADAKTLRAAARERLSQAGIQNAAQEADWLLCHASGFSAAALLAHQDNPLDEAAQKRLELELRRRENGEPIQYILGSAPFRDLELEVGPGALVPRPETELLVDLALSLLPDDGFVFMDWGTGSGCIAASILLERPRAFGFLAERNPKALSCAWRNLRRLGLLGRALLIHSRTPGDLPVGGGVRPGRQQSPLHSDGGRRRAHAGRAGLRAPHGPRRRCGRHGLLPRAFSSCAPLAETERISVAGGRGRAPGEGSESPARQRF